jgi:hypothetical protein
MSRWISAIAALCAVAAVLIAASIYLGRAQPSPDSFKALKIDDCDSVPCVQGVIPGVSAWSGVMARFVGKPGTNVFTYSIEVGMDTLIHTSFTSDNSHGRITNITVSSNVPAPSITTGMLVARYGPPCKVQVLASGNIVLFYPLVTAYLDIPRYLPDAPRRLDSALRASDITFSDRPSSCALNDFDIDTYYYELPWLGFAALKRYYMHP